MKYPDIDRLYKYCRYSKHSLTALRTMTFWFAKPASLNDPFDCRIPFDSRVTVEAVKKFLPRYARSNGLSKKRAQGILQLIARDGKIDSEFAKAWKNALSQASKDLEESGVFCLSECNNSILMWAHYADSHTGFCVEFDRNPGNDLGDYERTRKVRYGAAYPIINPLDSKAYDYKFFWKAAGWKYEKEWRLMKKRGGIAAPLSARISGIVFGLNTPARRKEAMRKILPGIQYRQCTKVPNRFGLEITDL